MLDRRNVSVYALDFVTQIVLQSTMSPDMSNDYLKKKKKSNFLFRFLSHMGHQYPRVLLVRSGN